MAKIHSYLTFNGNCKEAMLFYKNCLGGKLTIQTVGDTPVGEKLPPEIKDYILQATLLNDELVLIGTDMVADSGLNAGNAVSLFLTCNSISEVKRIFTKLSKEGLQTQPLDFSFWGNFSGSLTDKFGVCWVLQCTNDSSNNSTLN